MGCDRKTVHAEEMKELLEKMEPIMTPIAIMQTMMMRGGGEKYPTLYNPRIPTSLSLVS